MHYLEVRVSHTESSIHPMHAFEVEHDDFHGSELRYWNPSLGETNALVFRVWGDAEVYRDQLERREEALDFSIAPVDSGLFDCCVRERLTARDGPYVDAFAQGTLVVVPPIRYNQDRTVDVTLVGTSGDIDAVLESFPESDMLEVRAVGPFRRQAAGPAASLTRRQRDALRAAVDCGYYESPRTGTVGEVAAELGVSTSTAAEHLRKMEREVMNQVVDRPS
ncbi:helix-turn-helix domain-containing protein [Haloarchaeobius sp. TZWWS8]|uniref:helix-turn-helix domain-containing protein n=1 Tax=Haloarchaeobius sp. TZWWS8 TaxID=3446121 RepID=UPI003EB7FF50